MSKVCQVLNKKPQAGNHVSHANNKVRRRFMPNLHKQSFWVASEKRFVKLLVSAKGMRVIAKHGIDKILQDIKNYDLGISWLLRRMSVICR